MTIRMNFLEIGFKDKRNAKVKYRFRKLVGNWVN